MPIIVERLEANAERFKSVTGSATEVVGGLDALKSRLVEKTDEYAVILGPEVDLEAAAALSDTLRVTRPAVSVILIRRRVDTSVLAEALRSGMREVVEDRDLSGLAAALKRAAEVWEALNGAPISQGATKAGHIVTVFSPKGGVGKTTIAVNLSLALTEGGAKEVCLVDLDLAFGDVAITLQLFPARTLADAVTLEAGLDMEALRPLLTPHKDGLSALVAPVQPDAKDTISASLIGKVLRLLKLNFDFVVVDTSPSFDEHVLQAFDETDEILLVTTLDVPTLKNVKIATETLDLLNFPKPRRRLILNRADEKVGLSPDKVETTLDMKLDTSIPMSPQVANATNSGEPIFLAAPRHPVSQAIGALARSLGGEQSSEPTERPTGARVATTKRGLLRRSSR